MNPTERVVLLVDMDCFYCQVEEKLQPDLKGKPIAVVQYNEWKGGGIIAVNYVAKDRGVTRFMRGNEAREKCPDIELVTVPVVRGKADLTKYREAGTEVANVLLKFTKALERASIDEAYLDITENVNERLSTIHIDKEILKNTHVVESSLEDFLENIHHNLSDDNKRLAIGAMISEEIRTAVYEETGYRCSAGIAHNKILAKLSCGLHKPNQQTILPHDAVTEYFKKLPIHKIRSLGGKFGDAVAEDLGIKTVGELIKFSKKDLINRFDEKSGTWLYNIARGINYEPVTTRLIAKSIGCCKRFPGKNALFTEEDVKSWIKDLSTELLERLEKDMEENNRKAKGMSVSFQYREGRKSFHGSRVQALNTYDLDKVTKSFYEIIKKNCMKSDGTFHVTFMGLSSSKFETLKNNTQNIKSFFSTDNHSKYLNSNNDKIDEKHDNVNNFTKTVNIADFEKNIDITELEMKTAVESDESINNELENILSKNNTNKPESFFENYFSNISKRSFNTSRLIESVTDSDESLLKDNQIIAEDCASSNFNDESEITCDNCGEKVKESKLQLHLDYHLAVSLSEKEKENNYHELKKKSPHLNISKSVKRKGEEIVKTTPIYNYFKNKQEPSSSKGGNFEVCSECKKSVESYNLQDHLDYHVAKKLHLEINGKTTSGTSNKVLNKNALKNSNKMNKSKKNNIPSVISFFKQPAKF